MGYIEELCSFVEDRQVEKWKIIKLLEAAMAAPSACNNQPWEFIVITGKDRMDKLRNEDDRIWL